MPLSRVQRNASFPFSLSLTPTTNGPIGAHGVGNAVDLAAGEVAKGRQAGLLCPAERDISDRVLAVTDNDRAVGVDGVGDAKNATAREVAEADHFVAIRPAECFQSAGRVTIADDDRAISADAQGITPGSATRKIAEAEDFLCLRTVRCGDGEKQGKKPRMNE